MRMPMARNEGALTREGRPEDVGDNMHHCAVWVRSVITLMNKQRTTDVEFDLQLKRR